MAERCRNVLDLEIYPVDSNAGIHLDNVKVLCKQCSKKIRKKSIWGYKQSEYPESIRKDAIWRATYQCECTDDSCHD